MSGIFISYRRSDTLPWAGRLFDDLTRSFGKQQVFMDINGGIPRGANFENVLTEALANCEAMLVLIGPAWLSCTRTDGTARLAAPGDWVRNEVATGLRRGVPVVPVLLGGARLPAEQALPEEIRALSKRQAAAVEDVDWHHHVNLLVRDLERLSPLKSMRPLDEDDVESVSSGIRLLSDLVVRDRAVAASVGRSKEVLANTYRQVDRLELFKSIHDALHTIEMECLRPLQVAATVASVRPFRFGFLKEARRIRKALEREELDPALRDDLRDALTQIDAAFEAAANAPGAVTTARVLGELNTLVSGPPTRLDVAISDAARALSLDRLVELMDTVRNTLAERGADAALAGFVQGIGGLHRLRDELNQRTQEHSQLQSLDSKLRAVCLGGTAPGALADEWKRVRRVRARLTGPGSSELQAADEELAELENGIEAAVGHGDERRGFELVQDYFRAVGSVFRDVDAALKEFCMRLTGVNQALKAVLDVLDVA